VIKYNLKLNKMIDRLLKNWKTTSLGLMSIIGGLVRLAFVIKSGDVTEEAVMTIVTTELAGIGLLLAKDSDKTGV